MEGLNTTHLDILHLINQDLNTPTGIAKRLKLPNTTVRRRLKEIEEHGLAVGKRLGKIKVFELSTAGKDVAKTIAPKTRAPPKPRERTGEVLKAHKVQWSAAIIKRPWKLAKELEQNSFVVSEHKNWKKYAKKYMQEGVTIVFNPNKVHFFLHEFFIESPMEYYPIALKQVTSLCRDLEEKFPGLRLGEPKKLFTVHSQHIVKQGGPLAKKFEEHAVKTGVPTVFHGKRLDVDHSQGEWEEETKDPRLAPAHMEDLGQFFDLWLDQPFFPADVHRLVVRQESDSEAFAGRLTDLQERVGVVQADNKEVLEGLETLRTGLSMVGEGLQGQQRMMRGQQRISAAQGKTLVEQTRVTGAILKNMEVFGVAMAEHVTLVKALQANAAGLQRQSDTFAASQAKQFSLLVAAQERQNDALLSLAEAVRLSQRPWWVKMADSIKKWLLSRRKK